VRISSLETSRKGKKKTLRFGKPTQKQKAREGEREKKNQVKTTYRRRRRRRRRKKR